MADTERYPSKRAPWETGIPSITAMRTYDRFTDNTQLLVSIQLVLSAEISWSLINEALLS